MSITWITSHLGTGPYEYASADSNLFLIDVRDLVDKAGNPSDAVRAKVELGVAGLKSGRQVVVCCDYGISRSNAVAAGILACHENILFSEAVRIVLNKTGCAEIKLDPLVVVRDAIGRSEMTEKSLRPVVLVTGGRGFLGSRMCEILRAQYTVIAPSRQELDLEIGSAQLSLFVHDYQVDTVLHLANPRVFTSNIAMGKTLAMLRNVIEVCVAEGVHLVYPSGWEIYSGYTGSILADEHLPIYPLGPYGETKAMAENMINHWRRMSGLQCSIIRSSPVYGVGGDKPKFIYNFIGKALRNEKIVTHVYRNGEPALDLVHIDDVTNALLLGCEKKCNGDWNIGTGVLTKTNEIARLLVKGFESSSSIESIFIQSGTPLIAMNYARAREDLGWEPRIDLQEGMNQIITDYAK
jgi:nucleoside-diphosphate-sugar epimerase